MELMLGLPRHPRLSGNHIYRQNGLLVASRPYLQRILARNGAIGIARRASVKARTIEECHIRGEEATLVTESDDNPCHFIARREGAACGGPETPMRLWRPDLYTEPKAATEGMVKRVVDAHLLTTRSGRFAPRGPRWATCNRQAPSGRRAGESAAIRLG